jgi:uncharacterized membrane protein YkgB
LAATGRLLIRYSLVVVLVWVGGLKFTSYEAGAIQPFVENSPLISWVYGILSVAAFAAVLGVAEILAGLAIAGHPFAPGVAAAGSALAVVLFSVTLTFLLTTPGVWESSAGGFPVLSALPGQFLAKDALFLAASIWCLGDSLAALRGRGAHHDQTAA